MAHTSTGPEPLTAAKSAPLTGTIAVPGDKSMSQWALILGGLTVGETRVEGLLEGEDVIATADASGFGAEVERTGPGAWTVQGCGVGGLAEPGDVIDCGTQYGGALADGGGSRTADHSGVHRRRRPPTADGAGQRTVEQMGPVRWTCRRPVTDSRDGTGDADGDRLHTARRVRPGEIGDPACRAAAPGETAVVEPHPTRDHTETMLRHFGADVQVEPLDNGGRRIT